MSNVANIQLLENNEQLKYRINKNLEEYYKLPSGPGDFMNLLFDIQYAKNILFNINNIIRQHTTEIPGFDKDDLTNCYEKISDYLINNIAYLIKNNFIEATPVSKSKLDFKNMTKDILKGCDEIIISELDKKNGKHDIADFYISPGSRGSRGFSDSIDSILSRDALSMPFCSIDNNANQAQGSSQGSVFYGCVRIFNLCFKKNRDEEKSL